MKNLLLLIVVLLTTAVYSQEQDFDRKVYVYKTYQDYVNGRAEEKGLLDSHSWSMFSGTKIFLQSSSVDKPFFMVNDVWGFKIDKFLFRSVKGEYPACVLGEKGKYFYMNGVLPLERIKFDSPNLTISGMDEDFLFYSDDLESKIYPIDKIRSKEKNNDDYSSLVECLKRVKKRKTAQGVLNSQTDCLTDLLKV